MSKFYGFNIETPLSTLLGTPAFNTSILQHLLDISDGKIWLDIPKPDQIGNAKYIWRITDVQLSPEDGTMSYFRAFGLYGDQLPYTPFGVTWADCPHRINFRPDPNYYPVINGFNTVNVGGYFVRVLDEMYPSERLKFGFVGDVQHQGVFVTFRLFPMTENYPND